MLTSGVQTPPEWVQQVPGHGVKGLAAIAERIPNKIFIFLFLSNCFDRNYDFWRGFILGLMPQGARSALISKKIKIIRA